MKKHGVDFTNHIIHAVALLGAIALMPACAQTDDEISADDDQSEEETTQDETSALELNARDARLTNTVGVRGTTPFWIPCDVGQIAVGIYGRAGSYIDNIGLYCARVDNLSHWTRAVPKGHAGGSGGRAFNLKCPHTMALRGFYGNAGQGVDRIGLLCQDYTYGGPLHRVGPVGGVRTTPYRMLCDGNSAIGGIKGKSDSFIGSLSGACYRVSVSPP